MSLSHIIGNAAKFSTAAVDKHKLKKKLDVFIKH